jgi:hypothetical protein
MYDLLEAHQAAVREIILGTIVLKCAEIKERR